MDKTIKIQKLSLRRKEQITKQKKIKQNVYLSNVGVANENEELEVAPMRH